MKAQLVTKTTTKNKTFVYQTLLLFLEAGLDITYDHVEIGHSNLF